MKQYQIVTFVVICLTVITVYQMQKGLLEKTQSFFIASLDHLPEELSLAREQGDIGQPEKTNQPSATIVIKEKDAVKKCTKVKTKCNEVKNKKEKKTHQIMLDSKTTKVTPVNPEPTTEVLVKETGPISGSGCVGLIIF